MQKMLLWKVSIAKKGKRKIFKELYFIGEYQLQVSHNADFLINGSEENDIPPMFDFDVEIIGVDRVLEVDDIVNAHNMDDYDDEDEMEGYNVDQPYIAYDDPEFPQSMKAQITCTCGNKQNLGLFNFPFTKCHDCSRIILRRDIKEIGGLFIFEPTNGNGIIGKGNV